MDVKEGELKCVLEEDTAPSVMRGGIIKTLLWFVDNWDCLLMVCQSSVLECGVKLTPAYS